MTDLKTPENKHLTRTKFLLAKAYNVSKDKTKEQTIYIFRRFLFHDSMTLDKKLKENA